MQLTSAICVVILSATVSVSATPVKWEYGACDFGRRIGCSIGYKRDAAPAPIAEPVAEPVKWSYGACDFGRRIGCSIGYKRDTADEQAHHSYKRAAAGLASALSGAEVAKRSPVADFCHSESGPCTLAARSADALAVAVAGENATPEEYYNSLALGSVFAAPEGSEKRDVTEVTKREAEAFCNTEGQACHVAKRAAEAVAEALAEATEKRAEAIHAAAKALL